MTKNITPLFYTKRAHHISMYLLLGALLSLTATNCNIAPNFSGLAQAELPSTECITFIPIVPDKYVETIDNTQKKEIENLHHMSTQVSTPPITFEVTCDHCNYTNFLTEKELLKELAASKAHGLSTTTIQSIKYSTQALSYRFCHACYQCNTMNK